MGAELEARIGIDLDEVGLEIGVDEKVKAEEFEAAWLPIGIKLVVGGSDYLGSLFPHELV